MFESGRWGEPKGQYRAARGGILGPKCPSESEVAADVGRTSLLATYYARMIDDVAKKAAQMQREWEVEVQLVLRGEFSSFLLPCGFIAIYLGSIDTQ